MPDIFPGILALCRRPLSLFERVAGAMANEEPGIVVIEDRIAAKELTRLVGRYFAEMVKYVVDVERGIIALGGELHADAEHLLLERGCEQRDLWGANYYPGRGPEGCIEYVALINIRPAVGNRSMEIQDEAIRARVRELTYRLVGAGEPLE